MNENKKRREKLLAEIEWAKTVYDIAVSMNSPNFASFGVKVWVLERSLAKLDRRKIKRNACECEPKKISTKRLGMQVCNKECKPKQQSAKRLGMQVSNKSIDNETLIKAAKAYTFPLSIKKNE